MKFLAGAVVVAAATTLAAAAPATAEAAIGKVTVFSTEVTELTVWENPAGCVKLPLDSHVLFNQTDKDVRVYADPFCFTPSLTVPSGYGSHVALGTGSFSVDG